MNKKQRNKNRATAAALRQPREQSICMNCGEPGSHFAPPCFGDDGFFMCKSPFDAIREIMQDEERRGRDRTSDIRMAFTTTPIKKMYWEDKL